MKKLFIALILSIIFVSASFTAVMAAVSIGINATTNRYTLSGNFNVRNAIVAITVTDESGSMVYMNFDYTNNSGDFSHSFFLPLNLDSKTLYANANIVGETKSTVSFYHTKKAAYIGTSVNTNQIADNVFDKSSAGFSVYFYQEIGSGQNYDVECIINGEQYISETVTIPSHERVVKFFSLSGLNKDTYQLEINIKQGGVAISSLSPRTIAIIDSYGEKPLDFLSAIGMHVELTSSDSIHERWIKLVNRIGAKNFRPSNAVSWVNFETTPNVYNVATMQTKYINAVKEQKMNYLGNLIGANPLYAPGHPKTTEQINAYKNAVLSLLPYMDKYECWNEPDYTDAEKTYYDGDVVQYSNLLKTVSTAIRNSGSNIPVIGGVVSDVGQTFLGDMLGQGTYPYIDGVCFHPYYRANPDSFWIPSSQVWYNYDDKLSSFTEKQNAYGGWLDMYVSEFGWVTSADVTQDEQANRLVKGFMSNYDFGIKESYWFQYMNTSNSSNYGLMYRDINTGAYSPRKALVAYSNIASELNNAVYAGKLECIANGRFHVFSQLGSPVIVAWLKTGSQSYDFGDGAVIYDIYGNEVGTGSYTLTTIPVFVKNVSETWLENAVEASIQKSFTNAQPTVQSAQLSVPDTTVFDAEVLMSQTDLLGDNLISAYNNEAFCNKEELSYALWQLGLAEEKLAILYNVNDYEEFVFAESNQFDSERKIFADKMLRFADERNNLSKKAALLADEEFALHYAKAMSFVAASVNDWAKSFGKAIRVELLSITNNGNGASAAFEIDSYTGDRNIKAFIAVYNGNELVSIKAADFELARGLDEYSVTINQGNFIGCTVKPILFESIENLKPVKYTSN